MGCGESKPAAAKPVEISKTKKPAAPPREKKNRFDYMFTKKTGETLIKAPGQIDGEQFVCEELEDCRVFLVDHIAQINIDACTGCEFFVGPVHSSIFVRDSSNCKFTVVTQQFRARDLTDCDFALFCQTEPIIETSVKLRLACYNTGYFQLKEQMDKAGIDPLNNNWSMVYDFTKNVAKPNWEFLPQEDVRGMVKQTLCHALDGSPCVIPTTWQSRPRTDSGESTMLLMTLPHRDLAESLIDMAGGQGWLVVRTRIFDLGKDQAAALTKDKAFMAAFAAKGRTLGLELGGDGIHAAVAAVIAQEPSRWQPVLQIPPGSVKSAVNNFFLEWKEEQ